MSGICTILDLEFLKLSTPYTCSMLNNSFKTRPGETSGRVPMNFLKQIGPLSKTKLNLLVALFMSAFANLTFYKSVYSTFSEDFISVIAASSVILINTLVIFILLTVFTNHRFKKFIIGLFLFIAATSAYFMDQFGSVIDRTTILNILNTDLHEVLDLLSLKLFIYLFLLFIIPFIIIYKIKIRDLSFSKNAVFSFRDFGIGILIIFLTMLGFNRFYASFLREHKPLRYYSNPNFPIYTMIEFAISPDELSTDTLNTVGEDSRIAPTDVDRELIIVVVGETARAANFSLNGYPRKTNPLLEKEAVISYTQMQSCGTSTAVSVPCMFSVFGREDFSPNKGAHTQNILDVFSNTHDIEILWRDNNSNSKGVALRVPYENFRDPSVNTVCDVECRDVGMLVGLQAFIDASKKKDILIVLHQMGSHGPAYFKRYPKEFERFKPSCNSIDINNCTKDEIVNAYDNSILYTDYFLSEVIKLLKQNEKSYETAMLYISDHGESLGENGFYLHGLPMSIAPDEQTHVAAILWMGDRFRAEYDMPSLLARSKLKSSHDNVIHTLMGFLEIESSIYQPGLSLVNFKNQTQSGSH